MDSCKALCSEFCTDPRTVGVYCCDDGIAISFDKEGEKWIFLNWLCALELFQCLEVIEIETREPDMKNRLFKASYPPEITKKVKP